MWRWCRLGGVSHTQLNGASALDNRDRLMSELARRFRAPLRAFFNRRVKGDADVDDLVQEVFVRLTRHADLGTVANIDGYVFETAANLLRDRARRHAVRHVADHVEYEEQLDPAGFSPERVLLGKDALDRLVAALHELPEKSRMIFSLYHFEAMSHANIQRRLGVPVSTIEKHMARANAHLVRRLKWP